MTIEQLGFQQVQQFQNANKTELPNQAAAQQLDKLFLSHNQIMTRILQEGVKIPQELVEQIRDRADLLKRLYFGLDSYLVDSQLLPRDNDKYLYLKTNSLPLLIPNNFVNEEVQKEMLLSKNILINLVEEQTWWDANFENLEQADFLKVGLVFFSGHSGLKKEPIKMAHIQQGIELPQRAVVFSLRCNLLTLLLFFYHHQEYFHNLQAGINAYLKYVSQK